MRALILLFLPPLVLGCGTAAPPKPALPGAIPSAAEAPLPAITGPKTENPRYLQWAKHPVGTTVTAREVSDAPMTPTTTVTTTFKLTTLTEDRAVVEVSTETKVPGGAEYPPSTTEMMFVRWVAVAGTGKETDLGKPLGAFREEKVKLTVLGKEYAATRYEAKGRVEAGETLTETWINEDFPGGVLKSVHKIPAAKKTVTFDIVAVAKP